MTETLRSDLPEYPSSFLATHVYVAASSLRCTSDIIRVPFG